MNASTHLEQATDASLAMEQGFQDGIIARCLPVWIGNLGPGTAGTQPSLTPAQLSALMAALKTSLACRQRLNADLARIQGIYAYCGPLLQQALRESMPASVDCGSLYYRHFYFDISPEPEFASGRLPQREKDSYDIPLLDAALANFTAAEAGRHSLPRSDCIVQHDGNQLRQLSALAFAGHCRKLDLGQRYQEHLVSILEAPANRTASGHSLKSTLRDVQVSSMLIDAYRALSEGRLNAAELALVTRLCHEGAPGTLDGYPVVARQLTAYACKLEQIVVLDVNSSVLGFVSSKRVLVYIPDDPVSPWTAAADLDVFVRWTLGKRLADKPYQQFFSRFVRRRDSPMFFARVASELADVTDTASRDMDQHMAAYPLPLFEHLAQARIAQIKDDAASIAVPVAAIDREAWQAQQERLLDMAWAVAGVAGFFVPGLNALLLAVAAWGLLKDVFHAVEAWRDGDTRAALEHVLEIASTVVTLGVTAVAVRAISRAWTVSDQLVVARLEDGREKLWLFDLAPFRSAAPALQATVDGEGIYRLGEQRWVNMGGHFYAVQQRADDTWQILPRQGHGPLLQHNGAGAWRVWCEQPLEWDDTRKLFHRLGGEFVQVEPEQVDQVLAMHAMSADQLRGLHVCGQAPQACLVDTVSRVVLRNRIGALVQQLRSGQTVQDQALLARVRGWAGSDGMSHSELGEQVWARRHALLRQLYYEKYPVTAATQELQRDFASLHRLAAEELLATGNQEFLNLSAAAMARRIRGIRVLEALLFDTPQNLDLARVVLRVLQQMPGAGEGPRWQLFDGNAQRPLFSTEGSGRQLSLRYLGGEFHLQDQFAQPLAEAGELFQLLAMGYAPVQRVALNIGEPFALRLRAEIANRVSVQGGTLDRLLGARRPAMFFVLPQRLDNGRLGYPLSGLRRRLGGARQRPRNLVAELRDLYPGFDDNAVEGWLTQLRAARRDPVAELQMLKQQLAQLSKQLRVWQFATLKTWCWPARREFAQGLVKCWRHQVPRLPGAAEDTQGFVFSSYHSDLDELPDIPATVGFSHVSDMALRSLQLRGVPQDFLRAFPRLRQLSITHCRLRSLSVSPALAQGLEVLDLSGNQIQLDERMVGWLAGCRSLVYLNLSHNPLQRSFSVAGMRNLNALMLSNAQLTQVPDGVMDASRLHTLDLSENSIRALPYAFYRSNLWLTRRVRLFGNPLLQVQDTWHEVVSNQVPVQLRWLDLVPVEQRDRMGDIWSKLEGKERSREFFHLLERLTTSADFNHSFLSRYLALRVQRMLMYMSERPALQAELYAHAQTEHCQDNATLRFSDLEVRVKVWKALHESKSADRERALLCLGAQCWRLDALDTVAGLHAAREGRAEESLEFALAYRLELADILDLPIEHDEMLNPGVANLSAWDLAGAINLVRSAQARDALVDYLATQRFWQEYLAEKFTAHLRVPQFMHDELEALIEHNAAQADIDLLQARMQSREINMLEQLTREAIDRHLAAVMLPPIAPLP